MEGREMMGMYHKNRLVCPKYKRYIKKRTSKGMRRAAKKSCKEEFEEKITLTSKSKNYYGFDDWLFS